MSMSKKRAPTSGLTRDNWEDEDLPEEMGMFKKATSEQLKARPIRKARRRGDSAISGSPETSVFKNFNFAPASSDACEPPTFNFLGSSKSPSSSSTFNFSKPDLLPKSKDSFAPPTFSFGSIASLDKKETNGSPDAKISENKFPNFSFKGGSPQNPKGLVSLVSKTEDSSVATKTNGNMKSTSVTEVKSTDGKEDDRALYLDNLKSLNTSLLSWIKLHVERNAYINMSPVFKDYEKHLLDLKTKYNYKDDSGGVESAKPFVPEKTNFDPQSESRVTSTPKVTFETPKINGQSSFSFGTKAMEAPTELFAFGSQNKDKSKDSTSSFSFGSSTPFSDGSSSKPIDSFPATDNLTKPFSFGLAGKDPSSFSFATNTNTKKTETNEDSDEPPKVEVTEVKEEGALYERKCKLFYKKDDIYVDRGVGTLYLKPAGDKVQLVIRALTNLGNILLNIILNKSIPTQRVGKNNVLIVCVPNPPINPKEASTPVSMLIRVKTGDDADDLLEKIDKNKNLTKS